MGSLQLYSPSPHLAPCGVLEGVTRRQRVRQLTHEILLACKSAASPFTWLRTAGFARLAAALGAGAGADPEALAASLDETYSQLLDAVLSSLDRQLVLPPAARRDGGGGGSAGGAGTAAAGAEVSSSSGGGGGGGWSGAGAGAAAPPAKLPPGGLAPGHAPPEEWAAAMLALQGACALHAKTRAVMGSAHFLQLVTNRACACPAAAPAALRALLSALSAGAEAQALFAGGGALAQVARLAAGRSARQGGRGGGAVGGGAGVGGGANDRGPAVVPREAQLSALAFLHVFAVHVLAPSVRAGEVHVNTQRSSQQLLAAELGPAAAALVSRPYKQQQQQPDGGKDAGQNGADGGGGPSDFSAVLDAVAEAALAAMEGGG